MSSIESSSRSASEIMSKLLASNSSSLSLPSPLQLYQMGLILHQLNNDNSDNNLSRLFQRYTAQIPKSILKQDLLHPLEKAYDQQCDNNNSSGNHNNNLDALIAATQSMCGIYQSSPQICQAGYSTSLCICFAKSHFLLADYQQVILHTLSLLWKNGLLVQLNKQKDKEISMQTMVQWIEALQNHDGGTSCLRDLLHYKPPNTNTTTTTLKEDIQNLFSDNAQRNRLIQMFQQNQQQSTDNNDKERHSTVAQKKKSPRDEIEHRINQVKQVLPDLGRGYIETALSCFRGQVDTTVAALLQDDKRQLPAILQTLDPQLAAPKGDVPEQQQQGYTTSSLNASDRAIQQQHLAHLEETEERNHELLYAFGNKNENASPFNEYNDDYDDQYDGVDGGAGLGGRDGSTYDDDNTDFDRIRAYNQLAREAEREDEFWKANRNTNRQPKNKNNKTDNGDNDEKSGKAFGPDKIKGGRVLGPDGKPLPRQRGGKKAKQQQQQKQQQQNNNTGNNSANGPNKDKHNSQEEMSKIQKRRKNNNKAKVANHHRKERAQKKAAAAGL